MSYLPTCSTKGSILSAQCSMNVSLNMKTSTPYTARVTGAFLDSCSTCLTVLYPTGIMMMFFSDFYIPYTNFFIWPVGCESVEHIEQSMINHSISYIYQGLKPVQSTLIFTEQPLNNVQVITEQKNERHRFSLFSDNKAVQLTVCLCSTVFNPCLNRLTPETARVYSLFL